MTLAELEQSQKSPIVRDHLLIRRAIEEMIQLPTERWCKDDIIVTSSKTPLRKAILENVSSMLKVKEDDESIDTLGKVLTMVHEKRTAKSTYEALLFHLSCINSFFGLPKRKEKKS